MSKDGALYFDSRSIYQQVWHARELIATADSEDVSIYDPDTGVCVFRLKKDDAEQVGKWLLEKSKEMK